MNGFCCLVRRANVPFDTPLLHAAGRGLAAGHVLSATRQAPSVGAVAAPGDPAGFAALALDGTQAARDDDGRLLLLADVRLDNRTDLCGRLRIDPPAARTTTDAALILGGYRIWGADVVDHLEGDFVFALWDGRMRRLVCACDAMGMRALYLNETSGIFACATSLPAIRDLPHVAKTLDDREIATMLVRRALVGQDREATIYAHVRRLPPGTVCVVSPEHTTRRCYWSVEDVTRRKRRLPSKEAYYEAFREIFDEAVRCRLRGGAVGAHLSGGLDSTSIACVAASLLRPAGETLHAFGADAPDDFDGLLPAGFSSRERPFMEAAAHAHPNVALHVVTGHEVGLFENLEAYVDLTAYFPLNVWNWTYFDAINGRAQTLGLRGLLTGEHGNFGLSWPGTTPRSWRRSLRAAVRRFRQPVHDWRTLSAVSPDLARRVDLDARLKAPVPTRLRRIQRGVASRWRTAVLARYGIDLADPTADRRVLAFCLQVPDDVYRDAAHKRLLVRRSMTDVVPAEVLWRRQRGLQSADWYERTEAARPFLKRLLQRLDAQPLVRHYVDLDALRALLYHPPPRLAPDTIEKVHAIYSTKLLGGFGIALMLERLERTGRIAA